MFGCVTDIEYSKKSDGKVFERYGYVYDYNDYGETTVRTAADNISKTGYNNHLC